MRVSVLLPQFFLPQSAIKLGAFVTNIDEPHRDYHDPSPCKDFRVIEKIETHYDGTDTLGGHRNFGSELTAFLSSSISSRTKASIRITANLVKTYYLDNNGEWLYMTSCNSAPDQIISFISREPGYKKSNNCRFRCFQTALNMWTRSGVARICRYLAGVSSHRAFYVTGMGVNSSLLLKCGEYAVSHNFSQVDSMCDKFRMIEPFCHKL
jgi:hypothetical protein